MKTYELELKSGKTIEIIEEQIGWSIKPDYNQVIVFFNDYINGRYIGGINAIVFGPKTKKNKNEIIKQYEDDVIIDDIKDVTSGITIRKKTRFLDEKFKEIEIKNKNKQKI